MALHDDHEDVARDFAEARLTRREALQRLGLLGLGAAAAGSVLAAYPYGRRAGADTPTRVASAPKPPVDIAEGQGAWRMIDWGGIHEAFVDVPLWHKRGWGGFAVGFSRLHGFGGQYRFKGSSALEDAGVEWQIQKYIERPTSGRTSFPARCHQHGCEAYIGTHYADARVGNTSPPWGDWFDDTLRGEVAAEFGNVAAMCQFVGMDGQKADTEQGNWSLDYPGNTHTDQQVREQVYSWGLAVGQAILEAHPTCKMLAYHYAVPDGWWDTQHYQPDGRNPNPERGKQGLENSWWMGYLEAMATSGDRESRLVIIDADFYQGATQVAGATLANALKFETQRSMAWYSNNLPTKVWSAVCDRIDIAGFSWAGTDSSGGIYHHQPEPKFGQMLATFRQFSMGSRRANYTYEGAPDRYCWLDATTPAPELPRGVAEGAGSFDQKNNWYLVTTSNPPGGHLPGIRDAASRSPVSTTPPSVSARKPVDNGDGTYTITGSVYHADGIRCVRGFIHPDAAARFAAQMTWNEHGGDYTTNYDAATQDFELTVPATQGQYLMLTAVSIHDQEHSVRLRL